MRGTLASASRLRYIAIGGGKIRSNAAGVAWARDRIPTTLSDAVASDRFSCASPREEGGRLAPSPDSSNPCQTAEWLNLRLAHPGMDVPCNQPSGYTPARRDGHTSLGIIRSAIEYVGPRSMLGRLLKRGLRPQSMAGLALPHTGQALVAAVGRFSPLNVAKATSGKPWIGPAAAVQCFSEAHFPASCWPC